MKKEKKKSVLTRIIPYAGKRKYMLFLAMAFSALSGILLLMPMWYIHNIIKNVILNGNVNYTMIRENIAYAVIFPCVGLGLYVLAGIFSHLFAFEVEENILNSKLGNKIIKELKVILNREKVSVYDEKKHEGILRNIMVRTNSQNQAMVVLIINANKVEKRYKDILMELKNKVPEIVSLYVSLNNKRTNVAIGDKNIFIWGEKALKEEIAGIHFNISLKSFFQINLEQTKKLYKTAVDLLENIENKNVVDAYSGTGTIAMIMSKKASKVYAIELVESATRDGEKTAKENGIENIDFINGTVEDKLATLISEGKKIDAVVFDPPRKGIDENSLTEIAKTGIKEIVYISCNPSTFARDSEILGKLGYSLDRVQPVDMFPGTAHTEVVGRFYK